MDIIIIPFHDYKKWVNEGFRTRDAHVFQHLEKEEKIDKILVVNRPTSIAEILLKHKRWYVDEGETIREDKMVHLTQIGTKSYCLDILVPDLLKVVHEKKAWWFTAFRYPKVINAINESVNKIGMKNPTLLLQNPMAIGAVKGVNYKEFVFDAIDNWLYHPQMKDKELIKANYETVDQNADLILTVSESLTNLFKHNRNVHWVPNGVDVDYFKSAYKTDRSDRICIGYVGKIQERVNFSLVESCLKEFNQCDFVFIGPVLAQKKEIKMLQSKYANIHFTGDVHYNDLPSEMKMFDIAIIPHIIDEFTSSMNPLKLYEYLAAGKPVVTTSVAGTGNISPYVYSVDNDGDFIDVLRARIFNYKNETIDPNIISKSIPKECTWNYRVKCIMRELEKL